jgi:hypothetical protein
VTRKREAGGGEDEKAAGGRVPVGAGAEGWAVCSPAYASPACSSCVVSSSEPEPKAGLAYSEFGEGCQADAFGNSLRDLARDLQVRDNSVTCWARLVLRARPRDLQQAAEVG